jgi:UDP-N-acetylglucosamine diphosphorylase/glucosamine-1-phosphate N-acetyltransferase
MNIILFDPQARQKFFPLTLTRAVADFRAGILTARESWELQTGLKSYVITDDYLQKLYEPVPAGDYILIDASLAPSAELYNQIMALPKGAALQDNEGVFAGRVQLDKVPSFKDLDNIFSSRTTVNDAVRLSTPCELFQWNEKIITGHFGLVTKRRISQPIPETVNVMNAANIFIEEGAQLEYCILNATHGPIYIGKNAVIMEGSTIRGPFAMCEGAVLKMGSKVYGGTTLGPYCVGGGEMKNSILMGYSNKAHDGYLGDSVIGEWCNIGAGTSNSNLKNNAGEVRVWNYYTQDYVASGTKCGLIMGDYSRLAINTAINTGTVVGVCCNVFGEGLTPKVIPDFTWGMKGLSRYEFVKAVQDIAKWKSLKNENLDQRKIEVLRHIFEHYTD